VLWEKNVAMIQWAAGRPGRLKNITIELDADHRQPGNPDKLVCPKPDDLYCPAPEPKVYPVPFPLKPTIALYKVDNTPGQECDGLEVYGSDRRNNKPGAALGMTTFGEIGEPFAPPDKQSNIHIHDLSIDLDTIFPLRALVDQPRQERVGPARLTFMS
jgi:hypothetical protein